jgi:hypothetical protein
VTGRLINWVFDPLVVVGFLWLAWTYLSGPHSLRKAFLRGESPRELNPALAWRGSAWIGVFALDAVLHRLDGPDGGSAALLPVTTTLAALGICLLVAGVIGAYRLSRRQR